MKPNIFNNIFSHRAALIAVLVIGMAVGPAASMVQAQNAQTMNSPLPSEIVVDPNKSNFKLIVCDGPDMSHVKAGTKVMFNGKEVTLDGKSNPPGYIACNFNGMMIQIQHFINVMMVLGVLAAIGGFSYMGYLFITGTQENRKKAKDIFPKISIGFILMLSAWFIVYQIFSWLTDNVYLTTLLGGK